MSDETPEVEVQSEYVPTFDVEELFGNPAAGVDAGQAWRLSLLRRVLGHVTDEDHMGRGPRNTFDNLLTGLGEDDNTELKADEGEKLQTMLDTLVRIGLLETSDDGAYTVTENGWHELTH